MNINKSKLKIAFKKACCFVFNIPCSEIDGVITKVYAFLFNKPYVEYHITESHKKFSSGYPKKREQGLKVDQYHGLKSAYDIVTKNNIAFLNTMKPKSKTGKFLDVGCLTGDYSEIIKYSVPKLSKFDYYGADFDGEIIAKAKKAHPSASFFVSLAQDIRKPSNYFDIVFCSSVLQYTLFGWKKAVKEMCRVANKYVFITRLPLLEDESITQVEQRVSQHFIKEKRTLVLLNREELESFLTKKMKMKIIRRGIGVEEGKIVENNIKFKCWNYLLSK